MHNWPRRARLIIYRLVLPAITVYALLVVSQRMPRPLLSDSGLLDLLARIWLCFILAGNFFLIADIRKYERWLYGPTREIAESDVASKLWNGFTSLLFFVLTAVLSAWTVQTFLPGIVQYRNLVAVAYGFIAAFPTLVLRRRAPDPIG